MKTLIKTVILGIGTALLATLDVAVEDRATGFVVSLQVMTEAEAVMGRQRRTRRRGLAVGYSAGKASGAAAATAASAPAPAPAPAPAAQPAPAPAPAAQPASGPPVGSIVSVLPDGCSTVTMSGVQYNKCGNTYYRVAFQGSNLVYVVAQP
jgi:cysteine synthase